MHGLQPNPWMVLPFAALLAAIALVPLFRPGWWGRHYAKVSFGLGAVTLTYYLAGLQAHERVLHTAVEYTSFIALIGSLYVVSKLFGKARAQMAALNMEYDWKADSTYARADFADRHIRKVFGRNLRLNVPAGAQARVLSTEGTPRNWEVKWEVQGESSATEIMKLIGDQLVAGRWINQNSASKNGWKFSDGEDGEWRGAVEIRPAGSKIFNISLKVERAGASARVASRSWRPGCSTTGPPTAGS